jgi:hypothetical protein
MRTGAFNLLSSHPCIFFDIEIDPFVSRDAHYARYGAVPPSTSEGNRFIRDPDL